MYVRLAQIMRPPVEKIERDLRFYPKCRFADLYHTFDENKVTEIEFRFIRKEWKELILMFDGIYKLIRGVAVFRRGTREWTERHITTLRRYVSQLRLDLIMLVETLMRVVDEEELAWRNWLLNLTVIKRAGVTISRDDMKELYPTARVGLFRIILRQTFDPIQKLVDVIEAELLDNTVDEDKLRRLEDDMLMKVLPWIENTFKHSIERSK